MLGRLIYEKRYIDVIVKMPTTGGFLPLKIIWDNREYAVERLIDVISCRPQHVCHDGICLKHVCIINNKRKEIFYDEKSKKWFVEERKVQMDID